MDYDDMFKIASTGITIITFEADNRNIALRLTKNDYGGGMTVSSGSRWLDILINGSIYF